MKKLLLIYSLVSAPVLFFSQQLVEGQTESPCSGDPVEARRRPALGFKAGFNHADVYDAATLQFIASPHWGGIAGMWLALPIGTYLGFQPEVLISQKGFEGSGVIGITPYDIRRTSTYIDVPLQLQLKPARWFYILGGIQYSYLLKQKDELISSAGYESVSQVFANDNIRKNLLGLVSGVDVNFWHFVVSGRAGWDLVSNRGDGSSSTPRYKNFWLQATLGYRIF